MAKDKRGGSATPKKKKDGPKHSLDPGSRPKGGAGGMRSEATVCSSADRSPTSC